MIDGTHRGRTRTWGTRSAAAALVVVLALGAAGCQRKVEVQTGTKVVCTFGEVLSNDVRTISVPARDAAKYSVKTVTKLCDRHAKLNAIYEQAQQALLQGNVARAKAKLTQVVASDPAFRQAKAQLDTIIKGGKPKPDTTKPASKPATTTPSAGTTATIPNALTGWTPDAISGFSAAKALVDPISVSREYLPTGSSPAEALVIYAEQFLSPSAASAALATQVKSQYPKNAATITVNSHKAYFGTDGRQFAVIGFTSGNVMVALEMTAKPGSLGALKTPLTAAAKQLP